jgi:hypothetical protein
MKKYRRINSVLSLVICAAASSTNATLANEPGRGSDKDIKEAQGAALTNARYEKNEREASRSVVEARQASRDLGVSKMPGRGKPAGIASAKGAALQNSARQAARTNNGSAQTNFSNETKAADPNHPGGMMHPFPPSQ